MFNEQADSFILREIEIQAHLLKTKLTLMIIIMNYSAVIIKCGEYGFCIFSFLLFNSSTIYVSGAGNNRIQKFGTT